MRSPSAAFGTDDSPLCPEIDCIRQRLPNLSVTNAERRARAIGVGADRVLIAAGLLDEDVYLRELAATLRLQFDDLERVARVDCPLSDERLLEAVAAGILPVNATGDLAVAVAPRGTAARRLVELIAKQPALAQRIRLTTSDHLLRFVLRHAGDALGERATTALHMALPAMSAAPPRWRNSVGSAIAMGALASAAFLLQPQAAVLAFELMLALIFIAWIMLRLIGMVIERPHSPARAKIQDRELPVYTVMVALYREAASVEALVASIRNLDYPPEKLDVKMVVEADDIETQDALARHNAGRLFDIIVVPDFGPRTKPKALNAALPFARGSFLVIYDAEDRPEPDQLRRALDAFLSADPALACVQASLTIDNTGDNWLAALFTAEYAGQFDVFLPALSALRLPLPLGGSSNHFRTAVLRKVGAWDPYNVTEDADLGMRLARFGYRSGVIRPSTYEEAPTQFGPWLRQRTRWFKGWLQTWLVHMREPRRLMRELGLPGFLAFQLMVGGNVLAALIHPVFMIGVIVTLASGQTWLQDPVAGMLLGVSIVTGYLTSALLGAIGLLRRRLIATGWVLLLIPLHWLLLSLAAWRALIQLLRDPYRWEKTEHGLARTSRMMKRERAAGIVAEILKAASRPPRDSVADRRPLPQACA